MWSITTELGLTKSWRSALLKSKWTRAAKGGDRSFVQPWLRADVGSCSLGQLSGRRADGFKKPAGVNLHRESLKLVPSRLGLTFKMLTRTETSSTFRLSNLSFEKEHRRKQRSLICSSRSAHLGRRLLLACKSFVRAQVARTEILVVDGIVCRL